ncbi:YhcN/YlaJ family sporulation lipoprotein [Mesobacillus boroniphilus]|uniref:YhcN/YlaJ family sporulation lipoprotein n=1 Tax=Mesobacillus boroniphilus TaxID=308892 RepID=UPI001BCB496A|nr:YhcN/YlaJ family sporulation lipoprotein [Mesobacillus boroniphilus]
MNKRMLFVPIVSLLTIGVTACNGNDEAAVQGRNTDRGQPLGYYSNEKGNEIDVMDDREGAITEIFDHNFGKEGLAAESRKRRMLQSRDENGNPPNPTVPRSDHDHNFFQRDNKYSRGDLNYHGHLNEQRGSGQARIYFNTEQDNRLARKVGIAAESVDNVDKVRSVLFGQKVEIAVTFKDKSLKKQTKEKIRKAVLPYIEDRELNIIEDEGTFSRTRNIDYDRKNGNPRESLNFNP